MKYKAPYGSSDPDASYVDRSTPDARSGSKVPKQAVEHPQREIVEVIEDAGLTPSEGDLTQLRQAIDRKIEKVRVNLQVYPEVLSSDGKLTVTPVTPGLIRIPAGQEFVMRGGKLVTTGVVDLVTVANRTYHLRWRQEWVGAAGFALKNCADVGYNASGNVADEVLPVFDSTYDEPLFARVVTDGSNIATIHTLVNRPSMILHTERRDVLSNTLDWGALAGSSTTLNWSRTPDVVYFALNEFRSNNIGPDGSPTGEPAGIIRACGMRVPTAGRTRYGLPNLEFYYEDTSLNNGIASAALLVQALASQL
jgi:hypothetical protein